MRHRDMRKLVKDFSGIDFKNYKKVEKVIDEYITISPFNRNYFRIPTIKIVELTMRLAKLKYYLTTPDKQGEGR